MRGMKKRDRSVRATRAKSKSKTKAADRSVRATRAKSKSKTKAADKSVRATRAKSKSKTKAADKSVRATQSQTGMSVPHLFAAQGEVDQRALFHLVGLGRAGGWAGAG